MKTKYFIHAGLISIMLTFIAACNNKKTSDAEKEEEVIPENIVEMREDQVKMAGIETGSIEMRSLSGNLDVNGVVITSPENMASVCTPLGGYIKNTSLIPGSFVKQGQVLAMIENQEFISIQKEYLETRNKYNYAKNEYDRHTELYKENIYSEKNVQLVTSEYYSLKAQLKALEQQLTLIGLNPRNLNEDNISGSVAISSPITGYIKTVNVNTGKYVASTDVLFEIVNSDLLLLELTLYEKDADLVETGQKINFVINDEKEQHEAVLYQTGKFIGPDKTCKVYAKVISKCRNLMPGMYVSATIEANIRQVNSLPNESIVRFDDRNYIFLFERNKVENGKNFTEYRMVEVTKGITGEQYTEVILPEDIMVKDARVVIKGAYNLLSAKKNAGEMSCG